MQGWLGTVVQDLGYAQGKDFILEERFAEGSETRLADHAAELVRSKVDVILTVGSQGSSAAGRATSTIPIVIAAVATVALLSALAMVIETGMFFLVQSQFQASADAGAAGLQGRLSVRRGADGRARVPGDGGSGEGEGLRRDFADG